MTYDLAIAKIAPKIQATESPTYDLLVNIGAFHIEMAFFSATGKYISESGRDGGAHLLSQSRLLEKGSLKAFITGKSFNLCRRIHQILAQKLLWRYFISGSLKVDLTMKV